MNTAITVTIDGATYYAQPARIKSTSFGLEDHGITTAYIHCEWKGGGAAVGGYCLDDPTGRDGDYRRVGTAYGLDHLLRIMEVVGCSWERMPGKEIVVLFEPANNIGSQSVGIANLLNEKHLLLRKHADEWRSKVEKVAS